MVSFVLIQPTVSLFASAVYVNLLYYTPPAIIADTRAALGALRGSTTTKPRLGITMMSQRNAEMNPADDHIFVDIQNKVNNIAREQQYKDKIKSLEADLVKTKAALAAKSRPAATNTTPATNTAAVSSAETAQPRPPWWQRADRSRCNRGCGRDHGRGLGNNKYMGRGNRKIYHIHFH
ncbi:uncharacterized protein LOC143893738 [Temnothorax americanus]|uniref:uncharacterized protein LOC143893738 n=1 Tax=Temnothorax americanus TaxID=1964332 RepID=UPI004069732A